MIKTALLTLLVFLSISIQTAFVPHAHLLLGLACTIYLLGHQRLSLTLLSLGLFLEALLIHETHFMRFIFFPLLAVVLVESLTRNIGRTNVGLLRYFLNIFFVILLSELVISQSFQTAVILASVHALGFTCVFKFVGWRLMKRNPYHLNFVMKDEWY